MKKNTAIGIAEGILEFCNLHGDVISNLKLQKLLYYAQAWFLALYDRPMFSEDFEAWVHGPVERTSYDKFKRFRYKPIVFQPRNVSLTDRESFHIEEVMKVYGAESAFDLERRTHQEAPWKTARHGLPPDVPSTAIIKKEDMRRFYKQKLNG